MKYTISTIVSLVFCLCVAGQKVHRDCGTRTPKNPVIADLHQRTQFTTPFMLKVFIHVIANSDGSNRASQDTTILRQFENMRSFFAPQGVCFSLAGIQQINSDDLNDMNSDTEVNDLSQYLLPDCFSVFIHDTLYDNDGSLNGVAYDIPNDYLSIASYAINSITNRSTLAHEMGHNLGLYHTFEDFDGTKRENVPRSGSCSNCVDNGDYLCDTEADRDEGVDNNCVYTGTDTDGCGNQFTPDTHNIMAYGNRACRDVLTAGQGSRVAALINTNWILWENIATDNITIISNATISSGLHTVIARNQLTIVAPSYNVNGSARMNMGGQKVILGPGVKLAPSTGYTHIRSTAICQ